MNLKPIQIDPVLLKQLDQKQKQTGEYLLSCNIDYTDRVGIMDGLSGVALALSLFYRTTGDERYYNKMNEAIDLICEKMHTGKSPIECDKINQFDCKQNFSRLAWCYGDLTALFKYIKSFFKKK